MKVPCELRCPISGKILRNPYVAADGITYEETEIADWLASGHDVSPCTGLPLEHVKITPNKPLKIVVADFLDRASKAPEVEKPKDAERVPDEAIDATNELAEIQDKCQRARAVAEELAVDCRVFTGRLTSLASRAGFHPSVDVRSVDSLLACGNEQASRENYRGALLHFAHALMLNPDDPIILSAIGTAMFHLEDNDAALKLWARLLLIDPLRNGTHNNMGKTMAQLGDWRGARFFFDRAMELGPDDPVILNNVGILHHALGNYAEALDYFKRAVDARPAHPAFWRNRGDVRMAMGNSQKAVADYTESLRLRPDHAPTLQLHKKAVTRMMHAYPSS